MSNLEALRQFVESSKYSKSYTDYARQQADKAMELAKQRAPAPFHGKSAIPSAPVKSKASKYDVIAELEEEAPDPYKFIVKCGIKNGGARGWISLTIVGHHDTNPKDLLQWLKEVYELSGAATLPSPGSTIALPYRELTSKGKYGPAMKAANCSEVTKLFDEVDAFVTMMERRPDLAKELADEVDGELLNSGDLRWTFLGVLNKPPPKSKDPW
jgi:hypothetical protein